MIALLTAGLIVLAVLLFDTRSRLKQVERRLADQHHGAVRVETTVAEPPLGPPSPVADMPLAPPPVPVALPVEEQIAIAEPPPPDAPATATRGWSFEELFGGKLPIWAGGITLAIAGVLLVKYSIDLGLLSPAVRVALGLLFGAGLIGGAEGALRAQARVRDARIHQALSGAGIASLYAAIIAAANLYGLIGGGVAFAGLAAVTVGAMALSLRFGAPSAVLGLAGGLAAPALVSAGAPNVPLLCGYLALAVGGLAMLSRRQGWPWLGIAALVGGTGWSAILVLLGALDPLATVALGLLIGMIGIALPLLVAGDALGGRSGPALRAGSALAAAAQVAGIVGTGGFGALQWGLYLLLAAAVTLLADRKRMPREVPPASLAVGLILYAMWPAPTAGRFALTIGVLGAIHLAGALRTLWSNAGGRLEAASIAAGACAIWLIALLQFPPAATPDGRMATLAIALALVPAAVAALGWRTGSRSEDGRFALLASGSALLVIAAIGIGLPTIWQGIAMALALLAGAEAARRALGPAMRPACALLGLAMLLAGAESLWTWAEAALPSLAGVPLLARDLPTPDAALRLLGIPALLAGVALWRAAPLLSVVLRRAAIALVAALGTIALHSLYHRLGFQLSSPFALTNLGLADRLVWEALLIGAGVALWRGVGQRTTAAVFVSAGLWHLLWYDLLLFNPLWRSVALGSWPVVNLLLPLAALAFGGLWVLQRILPALPSRGVDIVRMLMLILLAALTLRQGFAGSIPFGTAISEAESIGWSVAAILLAIGFLLWGIRRQTHDWRIASLILMLAAVAKVFLLDASGLTGLLRIASFLALGFSLIGLGWLYSRFLGRSAP